MKKEVAQTWELVRDMVEYCGLYASDKSSWKVEYRTVAILAGSNWVVPPRYWVDKIKEIWDIDENEDMFKTFNDFHCMIWDLGGSVKSISLSENMKSIFLKNSAWVQSIPEDSLKYHIQNDCGNVKIYFKER